MTDQTNTSGSEKLPDPFRVPVSDLGIEDREILSAHAEKIARSDFSDAVSVLDAENCEKGIRACVFNGIKKQLLDLQLYFLNLTADDDTLYALEEPTKEQMGTKTFWVQPITK